MEIYGRGRACIPPFEHVRNALVHTPLGSALFACRGVQITIVILAVTIQLFELFLARSQTHHGHLLYLHQHFLTQKYHPVLKYAISFKHRVHLSYPHHSGVLLKI
jgi:hypothetical protein